MNSRLASASSSGNNMGPSRGFVDMGRPSIEIAVLDVGKSVGGCEKAISSYAFSSMPSRKGCTDLCWGEEMGEGENASDV